MLLARALQNRLAIKVRGIYPQIILEEKIMLKIYALIWVLGALAAGAFYLTGNFSPIVNVVFGFLSFGAIFMGMIAVLPYVTTHPSQTKR